MQTLALDLGSHSVRCGLAGQDQPRTVEASAVGVSAGEFVFPCKFGTRRSKTQVVDIFETAKRKSHQSDALDHLLDTALFPANGNLNRHCTPVVFGYPGNTKSSAGDRKFSSKKYVQTVVTSLFEYGEVPALFARPDVVLAAFACGRTSAVVADFGASQSTVARISEGAVSEISSWKFAGNELDTLTMKRLALENAGKFPTPFEAAEVDESYLRRAQAHTVQEMKQQIFRVSPLALSPPPERMRAAKKQGNSLMYKLPDNTEIDVASVFEYLPELYWNPRVTEKFHVPDFPGMQQALTAQFKAAEAETLFGEPLSPERGDTSAAVDLPLVLCGGVVQMTGFQARVQAELPSNISVLCPAAFGRPHVAWTGASVLGSLAACAGNLAISSKEYLEQGADRVADLLISS